MKVNCKVNKICDPYITKKGNSVCRVFCQFEDVLTKVFVSEDFAKSLKVGDSLPCLLRSYKGEMYLCLDL